MRTGDSPWTVGPEGERQLDLGGLADDRERAAVARALAPDPAVRFPSCAAFMDVLLSSAA